MPPDDLPLPSAPIKPVATVVFPLPDEGALTTNGPGGGHVLTIPMPRWPLRPASIGCLTLAISVTRSAASISRCGASRPVMTTCWLPGLASRTSTTSSTGIHPPLQRVGELVEDVEVVPLFG